MEFDERSRDYNVARRLTGLPSGLVSHVGHPRREARPGRTATASASGWADELKAYPKAVAGIGYAEAVKIYRAAQKLDGFPDDQDGSSVIAGAKAVLERGLHRRLPLGVQHQRPLPGRLTPRTGRRRRRG